MPTQRTTMRRVVRVTVALVAGATVAVAAVSADPVELDALGGPLVASTSDGLDGAAVASQGADRLALAGRLGRPAVYLALHGSEGLLGNTDRQWSYVRANLDGLWGNPFDLSRGFTDSVDKSIALARKVATRKLIVEHTIAAGGRCRSFVDDYYYDEVERRSGDVSFDRVGVALYAAENPNCWGVNGGVPAARQFYGRAGYGEVHTLFQPQNISGHVNAAAFPTIVPGSSGHTAYRTGDGVVVECPTDACTDPVFGVPFLQAIREAHARGASFTWFTGYSHGYGLGGRGWLAAVRRTYRMIEEQVGWREGDAVVVINYGGYRALPERNPNGTPADSTTGVVAWLLEQRPIPIGRG